MVWRIRGKIKRFHKAFLPLMLPLAASAAGTAGTAAAAGGAAAGGSALLGGLISGAGGLLGGLFGGGDDDTETQTLQYAQLPGYEESDAARKEMASRLQEWGGQEGYGAISPEWGDIWDRAKSKVSRYYWGDVGGTGLAGKVKAGAARRGMSDSPAIDTLMTRMGQQEGQQLGDMGIEQAMQEALFGEKGRQDWFSQMQNLASMKPSYTSTGSITTGSSGASTGEMVGELGSTIGSAVQSYGQNQWMENYLQEMLGGGNLGVASPN